MISTAGPSPCESSNVPLCGQMSPEIKWDQSGFSPDDQRNQSSGFNSYQSSSMDFS